MFIKYCVFHFSELCQICELPIRHLAVRRTNTDTECTHWREQSPEFILKSSKKTQYLKNTLYLALLLTNSTQPASVEFFSNRELEFQSIPAPNSKSRAKDGFRGVQIKNGEYRGLQVGRRRRKGAAAGLKKWIGADIGGCRNISPQNKILPVYRSIVNI